MRLIDADKLMENKFKNDISYNAFCNLVKRQPSVDAVQRTDDVLQRMQDIEQAQIEKAYDLGYAEGKADAEPHWTPCSEELPKENGNYLVTFHQTATEEDLGFDMDDTDVRKMRYDTKHGWRTPRHIPSWINDAVVSTVLAWMPLPEPWRGDSICK